MSEDGRASDEHAGRPTASEAQGESHKAVMPSSEMSETATSPEISDASEVSDVTAASMRPELAEKLAELEAVVVDGSHVPRMQGGLGRVVEAGMSGEAVTAQGVLAAIGGWRGVCESLAPATVYLVTYVLTQDPQISVIAPLALAGLAIVLRLIRREPVTAAFSGLLGALVCVFAVLITGEGSSYYVPGFWINGAWIAAHTISLLIGWPLIGLLLGFLRGSFTEWRKVRSLRHAAQLCTVVWIILFGARLGVQVPLYFADLAGQSGAFEALGIARLVMGVPLFAVAVIFTWLVLSRVSATIVSPEETVTSSSDE